jgi:hypothetical protein
MKWKQVVNKIRLFDSFNDKIIIKKGQRDKQMGATCGTLNCKGKKYQKSPRATIIRRPTMIDLS